MKRPAKARKTDRFKRSLLGFDSDTSPSGIKEQKCYSLPLYNIITQVILHLIFLGIAHFLLTALLFVNVLYYNALGDAMYRIQQDAVAELEIKKSRFITYLHRSESEEDAKAFIQSIRKLHPNATHHCYAFLIGEQSEIRRSNDDGEPGGTAGVPMLECLDRHHIQDITAVTVRYFGGVKLGAGGLIRAYAKSVSHALKEATLLEKRRMKRYVLHFDYALIGRFDHYFREQQLTILDKQYAQDVCYCYLCEYDNSEEIRELSAGACIPIFEEEIVCETAITPKEE